MFDYVAEVDEASPPESTPFGMVEVLLVKGRRVCQRDVAPCVSAYQLNVTPVIACYRPFILYL